MFFFIDIHWTRNHPTPGRADKGRSTYCEAARSETAASTKAKRKFLRHFGMHLTITKTVVREDLAKLCK